MWWPILIACLGAGGLVLLSLWCYYCVCVYYYKWYEKWTSSEFHTQLDKHKRLIPSDMTFNEYLYYWFTLRVVMGIAIALRYIAFKARLVWSRIPITAIAQLADGKQTVDEQLCSLLVDMSTGMTLQSMYTVTSVAVDPVSNEDCESVTESICGCFLLESFQYPHLSKDGKVYDRMVRRLEIHLKLKERLFMAADMQTDESDTVFPITAQDALMLVYYATATKYHAILHMYSNQAFLRSDEIKDHWHFVCSSYSKAMNIAAAHSDFATMHRSMPDEDFLAKHLHRQCLDADTIVSNHVTALVALAQYSRYLRFVLSARTALLEVMHEYECKISDREAYFLASVAHSIDHYSAERVDALAVYKYSQLPGTVVPLTPAWMRALLAAHLDTPLFSNKMKDSREKWHQALYQRMKAIDPQLADQVHTCVCH